MVVRLIELASSPPSLYLPVSEDDVRAFLRLPMLSPPDGLSAQIVGLIEAATLVAERYQGRDLVPRSYRLVVEPASGAVRLRRRVAAVNAVYAIDGDLDMTALPNDAWQYDELGQCVIIREAQARAAIDFRTAPIAPTESLRLGILHLISMWWSARLPVIEANEERGLVELPHSLTALLRHGGEPDGAIV
jgi:hypothetical protein